MNSVMSKVDQLVMEESVSNKCHCANLAQVTTTVHMLKKGKSDGVTGCSSNHIRNATVLFNTHLSLLSCMLKHVYVPETMSLSTIVPVPKNKRISLSLSDNYRVIALSSIFGKVLDRIILLERNADVFNISDL